MKMQNNTTTKPLNQNRMNVKYEIINGVTIIKNL
jgi:hypothetical protein